MPKPETSGRIIVFGDVIDDVVAVPQIAIRIDTDTPASIRHLAGGSAANTAAWLGSVGADVDFIGRVGASDLQRHQQLLINAGVRQRLSADLLLPTGTIVVIVDGDRRTMLTERGANAALDPADVTDQLLAGARLLHLTGYSLFGLPDSSAVGSLIERARSAGVEVSLDPGSAGFIRDYGPAKFLAAIAGASIIFPSLDEGRVLTGLDDPRLIAERLSRSFDLVALTVGSNGVVLARPGQKPTLIPAVMVPLVDPTGAGDAFTAGFLDSWVRTGNATTAALAGVGVAAHAVTVIGGRPSA